jgi:hypothetical protein
MAGFDLASAGWVCCMCCLGRCVFTAVLFCCLWCRCNPNLLDCVPVLIGGLNCLLFL